MPHPRPDWSAYADSVIRRLQRNHRERVGFEVDPEDQTAPSPAPEDAPPPSLLELLSGETELLQMPPEEVDVLLEAGRDPQATDGRGVDRPDVRIPPMELSLAIRLAATFRSRAGALAMLEPGAATVLDGFAPEETEVIVKLLGGCILPPGWRAGESERYLLPPGRGLLVVRPDIASGEVTKFANTRFATVLEEALDSELPLLVLLPTGAVLPKALATVMPAPRRLAPLDREVMIRHLRASHSATGKIAEGPVRAALPEDRALAALPFSAVRLALRAPTPLAVADRLAALTQPAPGPRLEEIGGDGAALRAARQLVADLQLWSEGKLAWSEMTRSMLLHGQPGTGKTWLARAMGNSAGLNFVTASFAAWQACGHLGDMLAAMQKSFAEARRLRPSVLFIDEVDAVGSRNDGDRHGSNYRRQVINGFLQQMDAISHLEGVIVIAACNFPDAIDPAVLRPGRFDIKIEVRLPDADALQGILSLQLGGMFPAAALRDLARAAVGSSAAEVDAAIRAAHAEARAESRELRLEELEARLAPHGHGQTWEWRVAVHECGHAIVCAALGLGTITRLLVRRDGGEILRKRGHSETRLEDLEAELAYTLGGRAAERLVLSSLSAGAGGSAASDLAIATRLALSIDSRYGLGAWGPIYLDAPDGALLHDPATRQRVRNRIEKAERQATAILRENSDLLERMAGALAEERLLSGSSIDDWLRQVRGASADPEDGPEPPGDIIRA
ncbi:AAA family ATPase [Defluviimonas salinarum]|uniref:AAA family ATPase n=1 Tax=Defluviimonas salinarum TaxID=2992147 RepID=A0ABT3JBA8_9RHOB|nr:AAA family ATPase [Defluviimonas salinarum]MCW3784735.1 AAA family ATPase [Defluviimonas salinarum]